MTVPNVTAGQGFRGSGEAACESDRRWLALAVAAVLTITGIRAAAIWLSPIELYPDEAQYWLWSRHLAAGYFSKPPMVAWLIAASTALGGDGEAWVRAPALLCHALAALLQLRIGQRLFGTRTGALAAMLYTLMPGVTLSSSVIATDAPLALFGSAALLAYVQLWLAPSRSLRRWAAAALGLSLGLAFLSKYAAVYLVIGLVVHALASGRARRLWDPAEIALALGLTLVVVSPNLVWNAGHGFSTVMHTVANARTEGRIGLLDPRGALGFVVGQLVVFGPVPFGALAVGVGLAVMRQRVLPEDLLLLCIAAPPLLIVFLEAAAVRANANWAAAAYFAGGPLVAAWLVRWRARRWTGLALSSQGALLALFLAAAVSPSIADALGLGSGLKRVRGRAEEAQLMQQGLEAARREGPVTAIAVDRRFELNTLAYYGRHELARLGAPPLRMWVRESRARNQAELARPLRPGPEGARVLFLSYVDAYRPEAQADFAKIETERRLQLRLDGRRSRQLTIFVARAFRPRPRDPLSGLPTPP